MEIRPAGDRVLVRRWVVPDSKSAPALADGRPVREGQVSLLHSLLLTEQPFRMKIVPRKRRHEKTASHWGAADQKQRAGDEDCCSNTSGVAFLGHGLAPMLWNYALGQFANLRHVSFVQDGSAKSFRGSLPEP
ncbi:MULTISPECIES: hypothetical protein [Neorhizobium]|uniref:hypothetical protein n=1 Tax=Neorhizobium TaxID=1525371 RepID=UPI001404B52D|nr:MULTISPECIES: hypothetical protein [Neorhizobium]